MNITFNSYKGFLSGSGGGGVHEKVDLRKFLHPINGQTKKNKGKARPANTIEYRTDGFNALDIAWRSGADESKSLDSEDEASQRIKHFGQYLRTLSFQSAENSSQLSDIDELSSHTTLYGQEVLKSEDSGSGNDPKEETSQDDLEEIQTVEKEDKKLPKGKKNRLTPDERKQLRQQARETKKNARVAKMQVKKNARESLDLTPSSNCIGFRSKAKHLKFLVDECIKAVAAVEENTKIQNTSRVLQIDDVTLYVADLKNLLDDEWLSDSNIGWVYAFLYEGYILPLLSQSLKNSKFYQYKEEKEVFVSPICLLLPTFTFLIANSPNPIDLLTCNVLPSGISDAQIVFCPLNDNDDFGCSEGGSHWSLVVFFKLQSSDDSSKKSYIQKALVYDSMFEANASETDRLVHNMAKILYNPKDPKSRLEWDIVHIRDSPQQTNGSDCGVYVTSVSSFLVSELLALAHTAVAPTASADPYIDLSLKNLRFSALDSRIWMLSTLLNFLKNPNTS